VKTIGTEQCAELILQLLAGKRDVIF